MFLNIHGFLWQNICFEPFQNMNFTIFLCKLSKTIWALVCVTLLMSHNRVTFPAATQARAQTAGRCSGSPCRRNLADPSGDRRDGRVGKAGQLIDVEAALLFLTAACSCLSSPLVSSADCAGCGEEIKQGQSLLALERQWHITCFKCRTCGCVLTGEYISKYVA